uniref:CSON007873 protein n=1 Tax=Culicoides sonorensis TaxID=179676 RepID=A0A336LE68_CULSO
MAEMYKRCLEKWEQNAATSDASSIKTQIEKYFQVAIKKEETRSNAARKIFGILVPHISDSNVSNLIEIFRYLISQSPQYMFKYFLPLLFNKVLELEKTKNFNLGFKIAGAFKIDMYDLNFEITTESVVFVMTVIQQWVWFHFKGGKKEANQNLRVIVFDNLKNILPFATPKDYVMIINKFLGSSSNLAAPLTQLKNGPELLKLIIKELFEFPIKLDAASENVLISNLPGYVKVLFGLQNTDKYLKQIEFYMLEKVQKKISNTQIIDFLNATCKLINDPSLENLNSVSSLLTEISPKANGTLSSKVTSSIECCLIIAKHFKQIVQTISQTLESSSFVILFKFVMSLIAVLRNCDSETNRGYCSECTNTKRHVAVLLIQANLNVFNSYFRNQTVNAELISHLTEHISYQMVTAEGLQCKYKEQYLENSLIFIYTTIVQESHLIAPEYLKYRLKLIKVFEKYFKGRNVSILTPQRVLVLYSKVYTLDENPQKHLSALALLILTETSHIYKISRADQVVKKRSSMVEFAEKSILQIIQQAKEEGFEAGELQSYNEVDIILLEMENIFKYSKNYERNVGLFNDLLSRTSDPLILGHALFLFELDEHNKIPENVIERIETDLKKIQPKTMLSEAILGLIVMRKYANEYNRDKETLKEVKFFGVSKSDKEDLNKNFEMLTIKSEHNTVKLLDEALKHYSMALNIASRDKYKALDELYSCVKIRRSIDTIALQYEQRGLHKQAMEAQHLSYMMAKAKDDDMGILIALSYFVENMKQYDELFKPNPKMIKTLNDSLQKFMENIDNLALYKKGFIYSAQLSLVSHYIDNGSLSEGQELLVMIDAVLNDIEDKKTMSYFLILRFKVLFLHLKLITEHNKSLSISTSAFAALIIAELNDTVEYKDEFQSCMPNMLFKMIEYIGYYQAARYDSKMMQNYIHLLFKIGAKKGMEIRCMQIYLTLTYTDLIEDNLSDVETHLKRMDLMLGYKPTQISMNSLIEQTPTKKLSNLEINITNDRVCSAVRRERPHSPAPYILSPPIEVPLSDIDKYMIRHDWKCKCIFCDIVQVKVYAFILGCFYARILFLNENYTESYKFYHKAINYWHNLKEAVSSSKDHTLYKNFMFYSLQIHMHICHCLIEMKKYDELKGVCNSIKDLLQENVWNDEAIIEECNFTIKIATETEFTLKTTPEKKFQSYDEFITDSDIQAILSPVPVPASLSQVPKSSKSIPIFVDLQKGAKLSPAHKKRLFFSKKKTTLESMDLQGLCVGLPSISQPPERFLNTKVPATELKKSSSSISKASSSKSTVSTAKRSTRTTTKKIETRSAVTPISSILPKKQLKFSPNLDSPCDESVIFVDEEPFMDAKCEKGLKQTVIKETTSSIPKRTTRLQANSKPKNISETIRKTEKKSAVITIDISDSDESEVIESSILEPTISVRRERIAARMKRCKESKQPNSKK